MEYERHEAILASLRVAVTVTPVLCATLLPEARAVQEERESFFTRWLKARYAATLARCGLTPGDLAETIGVAIDTPTGGRVRLSELARVAVERGPNTVSREDVQRKIVVQANVAGRDLGSTVDEIRERVAEAVPMPAGYHVEYGGQFESQEEATRRIALLSLLAVLLTDGVVSIASLVGFVTLFGIATRNGVLLVAHDQRLAAEGVPFRETVVRGSLERLAPILMTALTAGLALIPLALGGDDPARRSRARSPWWCWAGCSPRRPSTWWRCRRSTGCSHDRRRPTQPRPCRERPVEASTRAPRRRAVGMPTDASLAGRGTTARKRLGSSERRRSAAGRAGVGRWKCRQRLKVAPAFGGGATASMCRDISRCAPSRLPLKRS
mgnify:CR=1 FL=1